MASLVAIALLGSLVVAFQRPGKGRDVSARLAALGFYLVLFGFFGSSARAALESHSTRGLVAFGLLSAVFGIGLVVSLVKTVAAIRGRSSGDVSATH
jgi:hypothetical protein